MKYKIVLLALYAVGMFACKRHSVKGPNGFRSVPGVSIGPISFNLENNNYLPAATDETFKIESFDVTAIQKSNGATLSRLTIDAHAAVDKILWKACLVTNLEECSTGKLPGLVFETAALSPAGGHEVLNYIVQAAVCVRPERASPSGEVCGDFQPKEGVRFSLPANTKEQLKIFQEREVNLAKIWVTTDKFVRTTTDFAAALDDYYIKTKDEQAKEILEALHQNIAMGTDRLVELIISPDFDLLKSAYLATRSQINTDRQVFIPTSNDSLYTSFDEDTQKKYAFLTSKSIAVRPIQGDRLMMFVSTFERQDLLNETTEIIQKSVSRVVLVKNADGVDRSKDLEKSVFHKNYTPSAYDGTWHPTTSQKVKKIEILEETAEQKKTNKRTMNIWIECEEEANPCKVGPIEAYIHRSQGGSSGASDYYDIEKRHAKLVLGVALATVALAAGSAIGYDAFRNWRYNQTQLTKLKEFEELLLKIEGTSDKDLVEKVRSLQEAASGAKGKLLPRVKAAVEVVANKFSVEELSEKDLSIKERFKAEDFGEVEDLKFRQDFLSTGAKAGLFAAVALGVGGGLLAGGQVANLTSTPEFITKNTQLLDQIMIELEALRLNYLGVTQSN